jgi:hypothetical protein
VIVPDHITENLIETRIRENNDSDRLIKIYKNLISIKYKEVRDEAQATARRELEKQVKREARDDKYFLKRLKA